ncbi:MAG: RND family transporter, partial [Spongiibacter sp.]|nr:RND family transporter [Spongiibacter sp.]
MSATLATLYQRVVLAKAPWVLVALLALIAFLGSHLPDLKLDASSEALVLEGDKSLEYYREISKRYETEEFLIVTFQPKGDLFAPEQLATLAKLRDDLAALPRVSQVNSILDVPLLQSPPVGLSDVTSGDIPTLANGQADIDMARQEFATSPIYRSLLTSPDGSTTALQVNLQRDEKFYELVDARDQQRALSLKGEPGAEAALAEAQQRLDDYTAEVHER